MEYARIILLVLAVGIGVVCLVFLAKLTNDHGQYEAIKGIDNSLCALEEKVDSSLRSNSIEFHNNRVELNQSLGELRRELNEKLSETELKSLQLQHDHGESLSTNLTALREQSKQSMIQSYEQQRKIHVLVNDKLQQIYTGNEEKLEQMRKTVDEKLSETLTNRLDTSFKQVGEQLERVYKSLGEMQNLAQGVDRLQKVLTNVKTRGTWAEVQLGNILEQILTKDQYEENATIKQNSNERVEFVVKLPGKIDGEKVLLPIDAKFPQEDYIRIMEASEENDTKALQEATKALEDRIKREARTIRDKYISPPTTTDFAVMFLPTEGLYSEVLRRNGLSEMLQRDYKVMIAGPTTIAALLNSLSVGFKTLSIEKRSSEVWKMLGAIKDQYEKFTVLLVSAQKKLSEASSSIDKASHRARMIDKKLGRVESLDGSADMFLGLEQEYDENDEQDGDED